MTMTQINVREVYGFDSIDMRREPLEVPSSNGIWREFVAGPFMDVDVERDGVRINVKDWSARIGAQKLLTGLRALFERPTVYVVDAWDDTAQESHVKVFTDEAEAQAHLDRYVTKRKRHSIYAGVLKRKVK